MISTAAAPDPIRLEIFKHLFASIPDEMGAILRRSSYSPNIKERRDFSCALFDAAGEMVAQAAHIPVHLGAMPLSVRACIETHNFAPGDAVLLNDPYRGGTHLPDMTIVSPVFIPEGDTLLGFVASRAHHADVGGQAPGSMSLATEIYQEGLIVPPVKLLEAGKMNVDLLRLILANVRTPAEREGDLRAQLAANHRGVQRLQALVDPVGRAPLFTWMAELIGYAERATRTQIANLPEGRYAAEDVLDDDGVDPSPVLLQVAVEIQGDHAVVDFAGSSAQRRGGVNAVYAITVSAVMYVFRSLIGAEVPFNSGCLRPITIHAPAGSVLNAEPPAAVAAGNVETSQRIVDVLLRALSSAAPGRIPAASQGTMNNVTIGGYHPETGEPYTYYETIAGGAGGHPRRAGASAIHTHMTNTLNTPVEALEFTYPLRVQRYAIRRGSGGAGRQPGGDGVIREIELLAPATVSLLTDRRRSAPYGLDGGESGSPGRNILSEGVESVELLGKAKVEVSPGACLRIETPGGGGHGPTRG